MTGDRFIGKIRGVLLPGLVVTLGHRLDKEREVVDFPHENQCLG